MPRLTARLTGVRAPGGPLPPLFGGTMNRFTRPHSLTVGARMLLIPVLAWLGLPSLAGAVSPKTYWPVDDLRAGMKGYGKTVIKGTKVESFDVEVLGILKNTSPGRDLVLAKLS